MKTLLLAITLLSIHSVSAETTGQLLEKDKVVTNIDANGKATVSESEYVSLFFEASKDNNGFKLVGLVDQFEKNGLDNDKFAKGQNLKQLFLQMSH